MRMQSVQLCLRMLGAYCVYATEVTCHCKLAQGEALWAATCVINPKGWSKASSVRHKKTEIVWIYKKLLGCTSLGSPNRKMWILAPRPCIQFESQGVSLQDPRIFQKDLGSLDFSYRKKHNGTDLWIWMLFWFSLWIWEPNPPNIHGIRGLATEKWPSSSVWFSACRILGKFFSFKEGKAFTESVFPGLYLAWTILLLRCESSVAALSA